MKRVFIMTLAAMMTLTMAGCSQEPKEPTLYDFTAKVQNGEAAAAILKMNEKRPFCRDIK